MSVAHGASAEAETTFSRTMRPISSSRRVRAFLSIAAPGFEWPRWRASRPFELGAGAMRADVKKLAPGERFIVRTSDAEVEVRGTSFRVEVTSLRRPHQEQHALRRLQQALHGWQHVQGRSVQAVME